MPDEQDIALDINVTTAENITAIDVSAKINLKMSHLLKFFNEIQTKTSNEIPPKKHDEMIPLKKTYKNALLIGCNYRNTKYELNGCINDAANIKKILTDSYKFDNIVLMTDDTPIIPTKKNILVEITSLLHNANSGDTLFFSFSGHGVNVKDKNGDEKDKLDEVIVPIDFDYIIDDDLNELIRNHLKKDVTLFAIIDSCHSGTMLDLRYQYVDSTSSEKDTEELKYVETEGNVIMISGCMDSQTSMDAYIRSAGTYQGAMTFAFLESIKKNPNVSWIDLLTSMRDYLKNADFEQIPQLSSGKKLDLTLKFLSA